MKRYELLEKAQNGLIKRGDKFKSGSQTIEFDGTDFRYSNGTRLNLRVSDVDWTPVPKLITVELTQAQINTIYSLANHIDDDEMQCGNDSGYVTATTWNLFNKFEDLYKSVGGTK
ncbi:hypothetical protein [Bacillus wiedmannii]|uniref:hypothetical protein n=1 Tax=Bacillus wiedmannii TaxID=1890302 RepID=UPI000BEFACEB|nr:hypothetical protein [Bacillus wiedmannii]PEJ48380.1 hypothetical protein CN672_13630 [Bacillus wiedmannii]PEM10334.1 hypothetical protein CN610_14200 [Bacillus wiedmannii]PGD08286.1 hypothetical protein COM34_14390 [Bacillus wiedmannii]PHD09554.1 hypothetical protein COF45_17825 [Bacillus wiedmannii]